VRLFTALYSVTMGGCERAHRPRLFRLQRLAPSSIGARRPGPRSTILPRKGIKLVAATLPRCSKLNTMSNVFQAIFAGASTIAVPAIAYRFVDADPSVQTKPGKDPAIRSTCMQGVNRQEGSRRSLKEERKRKRKLASAVKTETTTPPGCGSFPVLPRLISSVSSVRFASAGIDAETRGLVLKSFAHTVAYRTLTPLDFCVDFDLQESTAFRWLFSNTTFLSSILHAAYAVNDITSPLWNGRPSKKTTLYLNKTLASLREQIDSQDALADESLLYIVGQLGYLESCFGHYKAAFAHFRGLRKIIDMRGGVQLLSRNPKLHFKTDRYVPQPSVVKTLAHVTPRLDLASHLSSGKRLYFSQNCSTWVPPCGPSPSSRGMYQPPRTWDVRLEYIFVDLQELVCNLNRHATNKTLYSAASFQSSLSSIQSRLGRITDLADDPSNELVRLTMLAFLSTMLSAPGVPVPYFWIIKQLKVTYERVSSSVDAMDSELQLWLLSIAAVSVVGTEEAWLQRAWNTNAGAMRWTELKGKLMKVLWIESIHDDPMERACWKLALDASCNGLGL
jgi:hypothetical protein